MCFHRLERRLRVDLHAAAHELLGRVVAQPARDLRQDLRRDVDENPALRRVTKTGIRVERVAHEVGQLRERLDARVARADEDERELAEALRFGRGRHRRFESSQDVVSKVDRVRERFEADAVVGEPRDRQRARDGAERDNDVSIPDVEERLFGLDPHALLLRVERRRASEQELGVRAHLPQRNDDVPRLERSRRRLREHRRVEHEVLGTDDRRAALAEQPRDVAAGEAAPEHERAALRLAVCHAPTLAAATKSPRADA